MRKQERHHLDFKWLLWAQQQDTLSKHKQNTGFCKSGAQPHHRAEEANGKDVHRMRRRKTQTERGEEEGTPCYHGVQRKTICLRPIHHLLVTKIHPSRSHFSSLPLPSPSLHCLPVFAERLQKGTVYAEKNDGIDILLAEIYIHRSSINTRALHAPPPIQPLTQHRQYGKSASGT